MERASEADRHLSDAAILRGQLDVDQVLELVAGDERTPARSRVSGELVSPADQLVDRVLQPAGRLPPDLPPLEPQPLPDEQPEPEEPLEPVLPPEEEPVPA